MIPDKTRRKGNLAPASLRSLPLDLHTRCMGKKSKEWGEKVQTVRCLPAHAPHSTRLGDLSHLLCSSTCRGHFLLLFQRLSLSSSVLTLLFPLAASRLRRTQDHYFSHHLILETHLELPVVGSLLSRGRFQTRLYWRSRGFLFFVTCLVPQHHLTGGSPLPVPGQG